jgi:hypothetical protein
MGEIEVMMEITIRDPRKASSRFAMAKALSDTIMKYLKTQNVVVVQSGIEHVQPELARIIHFSQDATSRWIRYQPDASMCSRRGSKQSAFLEFKAAESIEKAAYDTYMKLHRLDCKVLLFMCPNFIDNDLKRVKWNTIQNVKLESGEDTYEIRYKDAPPEWRRWPIYESWICPRRHPDYDKLKAAGEVPGSGTPYRFVDFNSLLSWDKFPACLNKWITS